MRVLRALAAMCALACSGDLIDDGAGDLTSEARIKASITVSPDPVDAYGGTYGARGAGFPAGVTVTLSISDPDCCETAEVTPQNDGTFVYQGSTGAPGWYAIDATAYIRHRTRDLASTDFLVQEVCGDGVCDAVENCQRCPADCGQCQP